MDAVLGQEAVADYLRSHLMDPPHLILWGPTGVGKTLLANAWITEQLKAQGIVAPEHRAVMTLCLSSADDRGIAAIRQRLTEFVRRVRPVAGTIAWILLDDADNLPIVTQQALRRILELHAHQARFIFIAQSPEHFIEPIQSRCVMLQCKSVDLGLGPGGHSRALVQREAAPITLTDDALALMGTLCNGNVRQFMLMHRAIVAAVPPGETVTQEVIQLLVNSPPIALLTRLQKAVAARDLSVITECVLALWSRGYSFEDCIAMLETVVHISETTEDMHYVLQCCAEGHIAQILNRMTTLDLIAVLSGQASGKALAEPCGVRR